MKDLLSILQHLAPPGNGGGVLATLVTVQGSSYRRPGARLFLGDNVRLGSVSGGCLEEDLAARAGAVAASGRAEVILYDTTSENDLVWGVGLGCHGVVQVLLEPVSTPLAWAAAALSNLRTGAPTPLSVVWRSGEPARLGTRLAGPGGDAAGDSGVYRDVIAPPRHLVVFGAGNDAQPLARIGDEVGWRVTVADPRPDFATAARFPGAERVVHAPAEGLVAQVDPPSDAAVVVMTHHYLHDVPLLRDLGKRPLAYLGLLGPRVRAERILADLEKTDPGTRAWAARLHAPVGLDVGAEAPEEVALSIVAEIQSAFSGRDARPLRERKGPIHG